jgi:Peptidase family C54
MMFGEALLLHHLGRDWVWQAAGSNSQQRNTPAERLHRDIVRLFLDNNAAPLSIHNILRFELISLGNLFDLQVLFLAYLIVAKGEVLTIPVPVPGTLCLATG